MAGSGVYAEITEGDVFKYYSDGEWKKSSSGKSVSIINPTTRKTQYKVQGIHIVYLCICMRLSVFFLFFFKHAWILEKHFEFQVGFELNDVYRVWICCQLYVWNWRGFLSRRMKKSWLSFAYCFYHFMCLFGMMMSLCLQFGRHFLLCRMGKRKAPSGITWAESIFILYN